MWSAAAVQIQCFAFGLRGEVMELRIVRSSEFILAPWDGSVIQRGGVATSVGREVAPRRGKRGDDASWADTNFTGPKNEENQRG
jgi:hypothetical protein